MADWIWYPGDFELYHSLCQNFDREGGVLAVDGKEYVLEAGKKTMLA